jgi:hypothetical protein
MEDAEEHSRSRSAEETATLADQAQAGAAEKWSKLINFNTFQPTNML